MLIVVFPSLALVAAMFWIASTFVQPAPPRLIYMSTGSESGAYHGYAKKYKEILARQGIVLELRASTGAVENLQRLKDDSSPITIGFIQGGVATPMIRPATQITWRKLTAWKNAPTIARFPLPIRIFAIRCANTSIWLALLWSERAGKRKRIDAVINGHRAIAMAGNHGYLYAT